MRISKKAEYALHTVLYLCIHTEQAQQLEKMADNQGVSKDYLAKVMQRLSGKGIVKAQPGVGGGYMLAKTPETITFAEVVGLFENPKNSFSCLYELRDCGAYPNCAIIDVMNGAVSAFYRELEKTSFADILKNAPVVEAMPSWLS